uniref:Uncharacterized protein n=1 Tax=Lepeophtheirus salmonis TaxID=72036 RepID=A0A0K2URY5_LEPSM
MPRERTKSTAGTRPSPPLKAVIAAKGKSMKA